MRMPGMVPAVPLRGSRARMPGRPDERRRKYISPPSMVTACPSTVAMAAPTTPVSITQTNT